MFRYTHSILAFSAFVFASGFAGPALSGCGDAADTTTGKRLQLKTRIEAPNAATFTSATGWDITLTKAALSTGPFYYFDGATIFSQNTGGWRPAFEHFIAGSTAYAHPGHYLKGNARGEMLSSASVDLVAGAAELTAGDGVTGLVRSATFSFGAPAVGALATTLGSHVLVLEGKAQKGADARLFRADIDAIDIADQQGRPILEGCPFKDVEFTANGTVTLRINVPLWFELVEFEQLPANAEGMVVAMTGIARNQLVRGLRAGDRYNFSFAK
jgi:hypothetical protein